MKKGLLIYFGVWAVTVAAFWLGLSRDAMGYSLLAFYAVLPAAGIICPAIMAANRCSFGFAIASSVVIGFFYSLAQYVTFSLLNMLNISFERINPFSVEAMIGGALTALLVFAFGGIIRLFRGR